MLLIQINLERLGFDFVKEDMTGFSLPEDVIQIYLIKDLLYKEKLCFMKKVNLDVMVQHVEHDVPTCV